MPLMLPGHSVGLLESGDAFFPALIASIDAAVQEVHLETYIFDFRGDAERVAQALERAGLRGVRVCVLVDGVGTPPLPDDWQLRFVKANVRWIRFAKLDRWGYLNARHWRRLHRKLCVVDAQVAFCGGLNILDDHMDPDRGPQNLPRLDYAVRIQGPSVMQIHRTMSRLWNRIAFTQSLAQGEFSTAAANLLERHRRLKRLPQVPLGSASSGPAVIEGVAAALVLRDNVLNRKRIEHSYLAAVASARSEVLIANAYFLPGGRLRRALVAAARRGVQVCLLLQGKYEYFMQYHGSRPIMAALLEAGVQIRIYERGFLHAKVAVVDGVWATVGSSNLDPLSLLYAREANLVFSSPAFGQRLRACLHAQWMEAGHPLDATTFAARPVGSRVLDWMAYAIMRLALALNRKSY